jgi:hypothetical protein
LGATFSPKLRQLLASILEVLQSPTELQIEDQTAFRLLLTYLLQSDDRKQVHALVKSLPPATLPAEIVVMLVRSVLLRQKASSADKEQLHREAMSKLEAHLASKSQAAAVAAVDQFTQKLDRLRIEIEALLVNFGKPAKTEIEEPSDEISVRPFYPDCKEITQGQSIVAHQWTSAEW